MSPKPIYDDLAHVARRRSSAKYRAAHRDLLNERARLYWQRRRAAAHDIVDDRVLPLSQRKQQCQHPNPPPPPHPEQQAECCPGGRSRTFAGYMMGRPRKYDGDKKERSKAASKTCYHSKRGRRGPPAPAPAPAPAPQREESAYIDLCTPEHSGPTCGGAVGEAASLRTFHTPVAGHRVVVQLVPYTPSPSPMMGQGTPLQLPPSPPPLSPPSPPLVADSTKEKPIGDSLRKALVEEVMGFQEDEMSPLRNADKGIHIPSIMGSSVTTNMYVLPKGSGTSTFLSPSFYACGVGDYIRMGIDFYDHIPNEQYDTIHAFFSSLDKQGVTCTRKKKTLAWAAHFILLDLPMGSQVASDGLPSWNVMTKDHVRHGLGVAGACLDDMGWIVCISSISGDSPSWVEKYAPKSELEIVYRFTVEDVEHKGFITHQGFSFEMDAFYMYVLRRMGSFTTPHKDSGNVLFSRHVLHHYLPESTCIVEAGEERICRAGVQRSVDFIQGLLEALCIPRGLALEMGSGTAPLMRACMATGRPCFSFDNDEHVIATIVRPLVARGPSIGHKVSCGEVDDSDYFEDAYGDPWTSD